MPTVYQRLSRLGYSLNQLQKIQVGILVNQEFKKLPRTKENHFAKVVSREPDGTFTALFYPNHFKEVIDNIIADFCAEKKIKPSADPVILNQERSQSKTRNKSEIQ